MFKRVLKHEFRAMFRDKMYAFLLFYPIMMSVVAYFLVPYLSEQENPIAGHLVTLMFILLNSFMFGAITGFTLLDDQDDNVLLSLRITPIDVKVYVFIKLMISYVLGIFATLLIIYASKFYDVVNLIDLIFILILVPMQGPLFALLINCFAKNKVEGFVMMKLSGIILLVPIASLFVTNWTELFLGILPGFWPARIISMQLLPLDYFLSASWIYFVIGIIVNIGVGYLFFTFYRKRVEI